MTKSLLVLGLTVAFTILLSLSVLADDSVTGLLAKASAENGAKLSKQCAVCHSFDKGGANKVGPNLWGVVGAKKGQSSGYAYSAALKSKGGVWDVAELDAFLTAPSKHIPGTKMTFAGLKKPQDRADMLKYLQSLK